MTTPKSLHLLGVVISEEFMNEGKDPLYELLLKEESKRANRYGRINMSISVDIRELEHWPREEVGTMLYERATMQVVLFARSWMCGYQEMESSLSYLEGKKLTPSISRQWASLCQLAYDLFTFGQMHIFGPYIMIPRDKVERACVVHRHSSRMKRIGDSRPKVRHEWETGRKSITRLVFTSKGKQCYYCGGVAIGVDHATPISRGGGNELENLVPCCRSCNSSKGTKTEAEFAEYRKGKNSGA